MGYAVARLADYESAPSRTRASAPRSASADKTGRSRGASSGRSAATARTRVKAGTHKKAVATPKKAIPKKAAATHKKAPTRTVAAPRRFTGARTRAANAATLWCVVGLTALSLMGLLRVGAVAAAVAGSHTVTKLETAIQAERRQAGRLEIDRGLLSRPSRIGHLAATSMNMTRADEIKFMTIPSSDIITGRASDSDPVAAKGGVKVQVTTASAPRNDTRSKPKVTSALAAIAAGEAQLLLAGGPGGAGQ